jgi:hypothetical protein
MQFEFSRQFPKISLNRVKSISQLPWQKNLFCDTILLAFVLRHDHSDYRTVSPYLKAFNFLNILENTSLIMF